MCLGLTARKKRAGARNELSDSYPELLLLIDACLSPASTQERSPTKASLEEI